MKKTTEQVKQANLKKCMICGQPVDKNKPEDHWSINGAVVGEYIEIRGHTMCRKNVDRLVILPNRGRVA
jgi:hypothetical protein